MIITLQRGADAEKVRRELVGLGQWVRAIERSAQGGSHLLLEGFSTRVDAAELAAIDGVESVSLPASDTPRVDAQPRAVMVAGLAVGGGAPPVLMSGPCCVESEERIDAIAAALAPLGVQFLRGGAFKPRTSPYAFQGHGEVALGWLRRAADRHGMRTVTEALSEADVEPVSAQADLVQVGSRNMQNYALLKAIGRAGRPVLLKRAMSASVSEWLLAAEYLLVHGAPGVIFCERGIRGFDGSTRHLLDLGAVALLTHVHGLPVVVDPSHATGRRDLILPLARAALAAGAAGVMIETHDDPARALSDGPQALLPGQLRGLSSQLRGEGASP